MKSEPQTFVEAFQCTASLDPDAPALLRLGGDDAISWRQYAERVRGIAAGLAALGVRRGDTVGLMLTNRPEFNLCDTAALHLGATPFSVYNTSSSEQISSVFSNAENRIVICEAQFVHMVPETWDGLLVCIDAEPEGTRSLATVEAEADPTFDFEETWRMVTPDDIATLIYTSGTTGPPKGVELTHANLMAELRAITAVLPFEFGDRMISYLPSAHLADRITAQYPSMVFGVTLSLPRKPAGHRDRAARGEADRVGGRAARVGEDQSGPRVGRRLRSGRSDLRRQSDAAPPPGA